MSSQTTAKSQQQKDDVVHARLGQLLETREFPKTICPSEVARAFDKEELAHLACATWRDAMPIVQAHVWSLRDQGILEILQKGEVIDPTWKAKDIKGPIRVRKNIMSGSTNDL